MKLKDDLDASDLSGPRILRGLTIRQKMRNLTDTRPPYTRLVPRAILFNAILMSLLVAPLTLLWVVLYFGFEFHEEIKPKKIIANLKRLFSDDPAD